MEGWHQLHQDGRQNAEAWVGAAGRITAPKDVHVLIPKTHEYVT